MAGSRRRAISTVIISFNESHRIPRCLESLSWADEIVVVDSGSTDGTREIAMTYTDKVHLIPWKGYGPQKQSAVDLASHDYVLSIDCDEIVPPELSREILDLLSSEHVHQAYSMPRRTFIGSKEIKHSGWNPDRVIRLFDRRKCRFSSDQVHEKVLVQGDVFRCRGPILHYSFSGLSDILAKLNHYTDIAAREMLTKGRKSNAWQVTVRPAFAFFKTYFLRLGFLDGLEGLEVAIYNSMTVFFKYAKFHHLRKEQRR